LGEGELYPAEISNLLELLEEQEEESPSVVSSSSSTTNVTSIQYNSFITVPGRRRCPQGERMNHRGVCTPKYVHNHNHPSSSSKSDGGGMDKQSDQMGQNDTRSKLMALLRSLSLSSKKVIDEEVERVTSSPETPESQSTSSRPSGFMIVVDR